MAENSKIEWTHHTFNPWRGCTKVSAGCANCYAESLSHRNLKTLGVWGPNGTRVVASETYWREPLQWNKLATCACGGGFRGTHSPYCPQSERPRVFCASLADVFEDWTGPMSGSNGVWLSKIDARPWTIRVRDDEPTVTMNDVRDRLFDLIDATPNLDWLLLTKRPENIAGMMEAAGVARPPRPNVWIGTSVENQAAADERIPHLMRVAAKVRFLSCEPLLGPVEFSDVTNRTDGVRQLGRKALEGVHWVIVGGESGPGARPMQIEWARSLVLQCRSAGIACFMKQLGACPTFTTWEGKPSVPVNNPLVARCYQGPVGKTGPLTLAGFRDKKGGNWSEWPADLKVREFPEVRS